MKKTLIAAGIAAVVAAPAAFAEVKISGVVEQQYMFVENADTTTSSDNSLTFSASEDLGNGMSAFAKIVLDSDNDSTKDEVVGIKGSFGTVVTGRMEGFGRGKVQSVSTFVGAGGANGEGLEGEIARAAQRLDGAIAYVSPTVNGFHIGLAAFDDYATDVAAFYSNGPLSLSASYEVQKPSSANLTADTNIDQKTTSVAGSYAMGDTKVSILWTEQENGAGTEANDTNHVFYRLDHKMGNNTISLGYLDNENATGGDDGDVTVVELVHSMSKQTGIYASLLMDDNVGGTADDDTLSVGMYHKF
jgi:hypothetical protein